jgi:hypothetical protein
MGLIEALRKAEDQARQTARRSMERAMGSLDDAERAIRRRMRIYPKSLAAMRVIDGARREPPEVTSTDPSDRRRFEDAQRRAIVTVHGHDADTEQIQIEDREEKTA